MIYLFQYQTMSFNWLRCSWFSLIVTTTSKTLVKIIKYIILSTIKIAKEENIQFENHNNEIIINIYQGSVDCSGSRLWCQDIKVLCLIQI